MRKLNRIILINAAGFDYIEFPVGGHSQVIGVNGHGKSTLLRTILFFYVGNNEKSSYALHETKADFVSHYLGDPPSYLIYEVAREDGQPAFHIAVTRPAGRIQFHFVDTPFSRRYYVDGDYVQPIESVEQNLREARCPVDSVASYDEFNQRIYGIASSPYSVFRPAPRSSGQVGVLPRIISGIFTVSQLDADKLKSALTCGVRRDSLTTELDLLLLKSQLENFRRVNQAVRTYLRYEDDALRLVETAEEYEEAKTERQRAIEDLVRMAKLLPQQVDKIQDGVRAVEIEKRTFLESYEAEKGDRDKSIEKLGKDIAVLDDKIRNGEAKLQDYQSRRIDVKAAELGNLPELREQKRLADEEYASLTAKYNDENERKERMKANVLQSWTELARQVEQKKAEAERMSGEALESLNTERADFYNALNAEQQRAKQSFAPRRARIDAARTRLNNDFKALSELNEPLELSKARRELEDKKSKEREVKSSIERLRSELAIAKEKYERGREKLDREAEGERLRLQKKIDDSKTLCDRAADEVEKFDDSLAHFFQCESPDTWVAAAKSLSRDTLFANARSLKAKRNFQAEAAAWGVEFDPKDLPELSGQYDREAVTAKLEQAQSDLKSAQEQLQAAQERYLSQVDAFEKQSAQLRNSTASQLDSSEELRRSVANEIVHLENRIVTLHGQFQKHCSDLRISLNTRDSALTADDEQLRKEEEDSERSFSIRKSNVDKDFDRRRRSVLESREQQLASIAQSEKEAEQNRQAESKRIEDLFQQSLTKEGVNLGLINSAKERAEAAQNNISRIEKHKDEVVQFQQIKKEFIDPLPSLRSQHRTASESLSEEKKQLQQIKARHERAMAALQVRENNLSEQAKEIDLDQSAVRSFQSDLRFVQESEYFQRDELVPASFYRAGATREFLVAASNAHQKCVQINDRGDKEARSFLNHFDAETLSRKVLGFSPIYPNFNWVIFVGAELRPFVKCRGIAGMKQIQTQEFEQLIRNICAKNSDFQDGIRQVKQTAALVQQNLKENNFVDVLDSVELKVDRVDNKLTQILSGLEGFAGLTFGADRDLFGKRADREQIDRAIETFECLLREIDRCHAQRLQLTDYFEFFIRVQENGHDMGWRKSLDHIGSTGTDYLVKMLIYLSLIQVYRERAIDSKSSSIVHCVLDETGVLAAKYIRSVLEYAKSRGIILITAGHAQQTVGFENWIRVFKRDQRFGGQTVLRKALKCN